ncbi:MAG: FkbM family methyltransferase [Alphaproteobacteria bacterium]
MRTARLPILKRLIPSLHKRAVRLLWTEGHGVVRREGALFLIDLNASHDRIILQHGLLEGAQRAFFFGKAREKNCDMLIDIGANAGLYSIFAALDDRFSDIVAYEPNQLCYDRLRANLLLNGLTDKVTTRRAAVSDRNGEVPFVYSPGNNDLFSQVVSEGNSRDTVPSIRLDDEWPVGGRRIAIKMDIEGHERTALNGMTALLRNNDCFLQVECWAQNAEPFIAAMQVEGYRLIHTIGEDCYFEKVPMN